MNFRKILTVLFMAASVCTAAFAEDIKNLVVVSSEENLSASEKAWLPASVRDEMESNLQSYTKYSFVSSSEKKFRNCRKNLKKLHLMNRQQFNLANLQQQVMQFF